MTISANQPYFMPYFPYWQLIHASDAFFMCDDYAFIYASLALEDVERICKIVNDLS